MLGVCIAAVHNKAYVEESTYVHMQVLVAVVLSYFITGDILAPLVREKLHTVLCACTLHLSWNPLSQREANIYIVTCSTLVIKINIPC